MDTQLTTSRAQAFAYDLTNAPAPQLIHAVIAGGDCPMALAARAELARRWGERAAGYEIALERYMRRLDETAQRLGVAETSPEAIAAMEAEGYRRAALEAIHALP